MCLSIYFNSSIIMNSNLFHLADEMCVCVYTLHDHLRLMAKYIIHFSRRSLSLAVEWDTHTFLWSKSLLHIMMAISSSFIRFCEKKGIIFHWSNYLLTSSLNNSDRSGDRHIGGLNDREVLTGKNGDWKKSKKDYLQPPPCELDSLIIIFYTYLLMMKNIQKCEIANETQHI